MTYRPLTTRQWWYVALAAHTRGVSDIDLGLSWMFIIDRSRFDWSMISCPDNPNGPKVSPTSRYTWLVCVAYSNLTLWFSRRAVLLCARSVIIHHPLPFPYPSHDRHRRAPSSVRPRSYPSPPSSHWSVTASPMPSWQHSLDATARTPSLRHSPVSVVSAFQFVRVEVCSCIRAHTFHFYPSLSHR